VPNILFLTQYYPPETGAPQNRLSSLAKNLQQQGWHVSVLTAMPNYPKMEIYEGYKGKIYNKQVEDNIVIHRCWLYISQSKNVWMRLLNYFSFVLSALLVGLFKVKKHDVILCESPPLFLGITALILKKVKSSKLVFNVSDLWPETAVQLGIVKNKAFIKTSERLEQYIYSHSDLISGQTLGIVNSIRTRTPSGKVALLRNGIDAKEFFKNTVDTAWRKDNGYSENDFIVLYGGILGYAQNLEVILKTAKILKQYSDIKFIIAGDGPNKENLQEWKINLELENVTFLPSQPAGEMPTLINACNTGVIPLRNLPLFKGAIPSKIFEYLLMSKPILLGVDGEAKTLFIDEVQCGLFFTPQNEKELADAVLKFKNDEALVNKLGENAKEYVLQNFDRGKIAAQFNTELLALIDA
jgi:glycosyltransferase involved in cell wall biosynthesis